MLEVFTEDGKVVRVWSALWVEMRRSVVSVSGEDADGVEIVPCWKGYGTQIAPVGGGCKDKLIGGAGLLHGIL